MPITLVTPLLRNGDDRRSSASRSASLSCRSGVMSLKRIPFFGKSGTSRMRARRSTWLLGLRSVSYFKSAHRVLEGGFEGLQLVDPSGGRPLTQRADEGRDVLLASGRHHLDPAIGQVAHETLEAQVTRRPLGEV